MKRILLLVFTVLLMSPIKAQKLFRIASNNPDTLYVHPSDTKDKKEFDILVENLTDKEQLIYWDTKLLMCGEQWDYSICDLNQCYAPFTKACPEDAPNVFSPKGMGKFLFDLYDKGIEGKAVYQMRFWIKGKKEQTLDTVLLHYNECVTAVDNASRIGSLVVQPNPVSEAMEVSLPNPSTDMKNYRVSIVSLMGLALNEVIPKFVSEKRMIVPVSNLSPGMYLLQFKNTHTGQIYLSRFIKI